MQHITYDTWMKELKRIATEDFEYEEIETWFDERDWIDYYQDGYTPMDALLEEEEALSE